MAPEPPPGVPLSGSEAPKRSATQDTAPNVARGDGREPMRPRDWVVAIGIGFVLVLIIAAIFRNGLAYMYGIH